MGSIEKEGSVTDLPTLVAELAREPWTWTGADFGSSGNQRIPLLELGTEDLFRVQEALRAFKDLELDGGEINRDNFPLPTLLDRLERAAVHIHQGCGFCIVRGLDPAKYSVEDNLLLFLGLGSYIGDLRGVQDRKGNVITHITDSGQWKVPYSQRHGIHTNADLPFHNDMGADVLALQVRQLAAKGGFSYVASASQVLSELVVSEPDVARSLFEAEWPIQVSGKSTRHVLAPLMQYHDGKLMVSLDPGRLGAHPATASLTAGAGIPPLTDAQRHALAAFSAAATKHRLQLDLQPGDLLFINNWTLLHARDTYDDNGEAGMRRHMLRLWLRSSRLGWDVPPSLRTPWEAAFGTTGYGSTKPGLGSRNWLYPVVPAVEYEVPKYTAGSAAFVLEDSDEDDKE
ncbi:hypothetical protein VTK73DRAFT_8568 [Phialemonium thermophilum]|uniref:TauD/TfdA-like domain-containing protein n=1 Tax=Phialemonium thermophilum TaxID=223376 RepID=A0ABR3XPP9_9PEZI